MQPIQRSPAVNFTDHQLEHPRPTRQERAQNIFQWHFIQMKPSEQEFYERILREQEEKIRQKMIIRIRRRQFAHVLEQDVPLPKKPGNK